MKLGNVKEPNFNSNPIAQTKISIFYELNIPESSSLSCGLPEPQEHQEEISIKLK